MTFTKKTKLIIEEDVVPQEKQLLNFLDPVKEEPFIVEAQAQAQAEAEAEAEAVVEPIKLNVKKPKTLKSKKAYVSRQQTKKNNIVIESDTPPTP